MVWVVKFTRLNSRHFSFYSSPQPTPAHFLFPISLSLFLRHSAPCVGDYSHAITLPVSCYLQEQKVERNSTHKVNYRCYCHFQAWNLYGYPKELGGLPSRWRGDGWILQIAYLLENYFGTVVWQCRYIRGRCSYACRTKRGRKTLDLWRNSWYYRMYNVIADLSQRPKSLWPYSTVLWSYFTACTVHLYTVFITTT
jgi:hypothetical protein